MTGTVSTFAIGIIEHLLISKGVKMQPSLTFTHENLWNLLCSITIKRPLILSILKNS
jgi:hypothetical protein